MKKMIAFMLIFAFACFLMPSKNVVAQTNEPAREIAVGDWGRIKLYEDMTIEIVTKDVKATSQFKYKTIGFTVARGKSFSSNVLIESESLNHYSVHDYGTKYIYNDLYRDKHGNMQWIEFSLDSANVEVTTTIEGQYEVNVWKLPGDKVERMIRDRYPEWAEKLKEELLVPYDALIVQTDKTGESMETIRIDSIMTVVHYKNGENNLKGGMVDAGNGRVVTYGLTYWNIDGMRCKKCSSEAMFNTPLYDGYPAYDTTIAFKNSGLNERICWKCE